MEIRTLARLLNAKPLTVEGWMAMHNKRPLETTFRNQEISGGYCWLCLECLSKTHTILTTIKYAPEVANIPLRIYAEMNGGRIDASYIGHFIDTKETLILKLKNALIRLGDLPNAP